ncbi:MAG: hypothetical protein JWM76_3032 [Pseudonocardiales bacterium]|nr:hypothetical protein [Pseudonocardiales bacterium]
MRELNRNASQRDEAAEQRDLEGQRRDDAAGKRDVDGEQRDQIAEQRDIDGEQRDATAERRDRTTGAAHDVITETRDRLSVAREAAASERRRSSEDRRAAADERMQAGLDRGIAMADRMAGASGRDDSGVDRDNSTDDREASARYRRYATEMATSLEFGWTVRQLDPPQFLFVSPGCMKILGLDPDGPPATLPAVQAMIHSDDPTQVTTQFWASDHAGRIAQREMQFMRPGGEVRWLRVTTHPVLAEDGTVMRAADTLEDVTDERRSREALAAQVDAERANKAKDEFLSRVSHELRTPVNAVLGFAQLLELDDLAESQADSVRHILQSGRHLRELIDDLLEFPVHETGGEIEIALIPVPYRQLVIDAVDLMTPAAEAAGVTLRVDHGRSDSESYVYGDARRLRQVLLNLLSNAIKYNVPAGRVEIGCVLLDDSHLRLAVTDTGVGIEAQYLPRVFTAFDRMAHQNSNIEGTGLGLALCQRLTEMMGGTIDVASQVGSGTTVTLTLPVCAGS